MGLSVRGGAMPERQGEREENTVLGLNDDSPQSWYLLQDRQLTVSIRALEAIEHGDFRKLPGGIYNTNYIKQYARAIDYDESTLLAFYHREMARVAAPRPGANGEPMYSGLRSVSTLFGS